MARLEGQWIAFRRKSSLGYGCTIAPSWTVLLPHQILASLIFAIPSRKKE
jgi:hypothetical protein